MYDGELQGNFTLIDDIFGTVGKDAIPEWKHNVSSMTDTEYLSVPNARSTEKQDCTNELDLCSHIFFHCRKKCKM